jgi:hypothetical protein
MAAADHEFHNPGSLVNGKSHIESTAQIRNGLNRFLNDDVYKVKGGKKVPYGERSPRDVQTAKSLIQAIDDAHQGQYKGFENYPGLEGSCGA